MNLDDIILTEHQRTDLAEIIERMKGNEPGLYLRKIGPLAVIRKDAKLRLQRERFMAEVKRGRYTLVKKLQDVAIFKEVESGRQRIL